VSASVIAAGTVVILVSEQWAPGTALGKRLVASSFQAISASTTDGFNTLDIGAMSATSLFTIVLLMFVGASPGSTGGGIKTTTLGIMFLDARKKLLGERDANLFGRSISPDTAEKAFTIFFLFVLTAVVDVLILTTVERADFLRLLFEIVSALGNTGLSTGITPDLGTTAKLVLGVTMFVGRVGPLTIGLALVRRAHPMHFRYPMEDAHVG
jgi:trk system potassium uptake protein TrkH